MRGVRQLIGDFILYLGTTLVNPQSFGILFQWFRNSSTAQPLRDGTNVYYSGAKGASVDLDAGGDPVNGFGFRANGSTHWESEEESLAVFGNFRVDLTVDFGTATGNDTMWNIGSYNVNTEGARMYFTSTQIVFQGGNGDRWTIAWNHEGTGKRYHTSCRFNGDFAELWVNNHKITRDFRGTPLGSRTIQLGSADGNEYCTDSLLSNFEIYNFNGDTLYHKWTFDNIDAGPVSQNDTPTYVYDRSGNGNGLITNNQYFGAFESTSLSRNRDSFLYHDASSEVGRRSFLSVGQAAHFDSGVNPNAIGIHPIGTRPDSQDTWFGFSVNSRKGNDMTSAIECGLNCNADDQWTWIIDGSFSGTHFLTSAVRGHIELRHDGVTLSFYIDGVLQGTKALGTSTSFDTLAIYNKNTNIAWSGAWYSTDQAVTKNYYTPSEVTPYEYGERGGRCSIPRVNGADYFGMTGVNYDTNSRLYAYSSRITQSPCLNGNNSNRVEFIGDQGYTDGYDVASWKGWFRQDVTHNGILWSKQTGSGALDGWAIWTLNGKLAFRLFSDYQGGAGPILSVDTTNVVFTNGSWVYYEIDYDGSGNASGVTMKTGPHPDSLTTEALTIVADALNPATIPNSGHNLTLLGRTGSTSNRLQGDICGMELTIAGNTSYIPCGEGVGEYVGICGHEKGIASLSTGTESTMWTATQDVFDWKQANGFTGSRYYDGGHGNVTSIGPADFNDHKITCSFSTPNTTGTKVVWGSASTGSEFNLRVTGSTIAFYYQNVVATSTVSVTAGAVYDVECTWNNTTDTCTISVNNETPVASGAGNGSMPTDDICIGGRLNNGVVDSYMTGIILNVQLLDSSDTVLAEFIGNDGADERRKMFEYTTSTGFHRSSKFLTNTPANVMHLWEVNHTTPTNGVLINQDDTVSERAFSRDYNGGQHRFITWDSTDTINIQNVTAGTWTECGGVDGTTKFYRADLATENTWTVSSGLKQSVQPIEIGGRLATDYQMAGKVGTYLMIDLDATTKTRNEIQEWFYNNRLGRDRWSVSQQDITDYGIVYGAFPDGGNTYISIDGSDRGDWFLYDSSVVPTKSTSRKNGLRDTVGTYHAYRSAGNVKAAEYPAFNGTDCFGFSTKNPSGNYLLRSDQCKFDLCGGTTDNGKLATSFGDRSTDGTSLCNGYYPLFSKIIDVSQDRVRKYAFEDQILQSEYDQLT